MQLASEMASKNWAMEPRRLEDFLRSFKAFDPESIEKGPVAREARRAGSDKPRYERSRGGVAMIFITGIILQEVPYWYSWYDIAATSVRDVRDALNEALGDELITSILLVIDSPGGVVDGTQELADAIFNARDVKPIRAHIANLGASAAYWLASQASAISANETAEDGSIGVYTGYLDSSKAYEEAGYEVKLVTSGKYKGAGYPGTEIKDEQLGPVQEVIDGLTEMFIAAIARGRGVSVAEITKLATGRTWLAHESKKLGLIDSVMNFDAAVAWDGVRDLSSSSATEEDGSMSENSGSESALAPEAQAAENKPVTEGGLVNALKSAFGGGTPKAEAKPVQGAEQLKALEAAFPEHPSFAREMFDAGKSVEEATAAHYAVVVADNTSLRAEVATAKAAAEESGVVLAETEASIKNAGAKPIPIASKKNSADPKAEYAAKVKELSEAGDNTPEATIAQKFSELAEAHTAAVNAEDEEE